MHIKDLVTRALPHIPFRTVFAAKAFLNDFDYDDQLALITALYVGSSHNHRTELMEDYVNLDRSYCDDIPEDEFAQVLYEKNSQLATYYHDFIVCGGSERGYLDRF